MMICNCKDWEKNIVELNKPWSLWSAHGGKGYEGKHFVYCPWCGKKLKDFNEDE